ETDERGGIEKGVHGISACTVPGARDTYAELCRFQKGAIAPQREGAEHDCRLASMKACLHCSYKFSRPMLDTTWKDDGQ
ncbi:hypothetical protein THAOC_26688, partial [Thalassiosira oceanica]